VTRNIKMQTKLPLCDGHRFVVFNLLTPNVNYNGRTASLTSKVAFYIFIQQIEVLNILNMVYTLHDRLCGLVVRVSGYR